MNNSAAIIIIIFLCLMNMSQVVLRAESRATIIAAIEDNGCASYQPPAPGYKQRIETYNIESLKGSN